jgi:hypothetical protein
MRLDELLFTVHSAQTLSELGAAAVLAGRDVVGASGAVFVPAPPFGPFQEAAAMFHESVPDRQGKLSRPSRPLCVSTAARADLVWASPLPSRQPTRTVAASEFKTFPERAVSSSSSYRSGSCKQRARETACSSSQVVTAQSAFRGTARSSAAPKTELVAVHDGEPDVEQRARPKNQRSSSSLSPNPNEQQSTATSLASPSIKARDSFSS